MKGLAAARASAASDWYAVEEATFEEQRAYIEYAVQALEAGLPDSPLCVAQLRHTTPALLFLS